MICDTEQGTFYKTNKIGLDILRLLEKNKTSVDEISVILSKNYGVDEELIRKDVTSFLEQLSKLKIVNQETGSLSV